MWDWLATEERKAERLVPLRRLFSRSHALRSLQRRRLPRTTERERERATHGLPHTHSESRHRSTSMTRCRPICMLFRGAHFQSVPSPLSCLLQPTPTRSQHCRRVSTSRQRARGVGEEGVMPEVQIYPTLSSQRTERKIAAIHGQAVTWQNYHCPGACMSTLTITISTTCTCGADGPPNTTFLGPSS